MNLIFLHILIAPFLLLESYLSNDSAQKIVKINTQSSYVEIHGSTNVNNFNCSYNASLPENKFIVKLIKKGHITEVEHQALLLKVVDFKCPHSQMTNDLHDLLKYDEYPHITFQLKKISDNKIAHLMIGMAGNQQSYQVRLDNSIHNSQLICKAKMKLRITDFGLEPPVKFLGMVKVSENIEVEFRIDMNIYDK